MPPPIFRVTHTACPEQTALPLCPGWWLLPCRSCVFGKLLNYVHLLYHLVNIMDKHNKQQSPHGSLCHAGRAGHALFFTLRACAFWRSSSRWRFRALFWALNFALLRSRFCVRAFALPRSLIFRAPRLFALFFALLDFSRSYICDNCFSRS